LAFTIQTGSGRGETIVDAFRVAAGRIDVEPDFLVVTVPSSTHVETLRALTRKRFPKAQIHMASSCRGSMSDQGVFLGPDTISLLAVSDPMGGYGTAAGTALLAGPRQAAIVLLKQAIERADRVGEVPSLVWLTTTPGIEEEVVAGIHEALGGQAPIYGGSAADETLTGEWWVADAQGHYGEGMVISVFFPTAHVLHAFHAGYAPTQLSGVVTSVDGRTIKTIDDRPALEVYREWTKGTLELPAGGEILSATTLAPLGVQVGSVNLMPYFRLMHPAVAGRDGSLDLFAEVNQGETLRLFSGSKASIMSRAGRVAAAATDMDGLGKDDIRGALVTFCAGCLLTVEPAAETVVHGLEAALPGVPFIGQFTYGEQGAFPGGENCHGNLMISVVLFRDRP